RRTKTPEACRCSWPTSTAASRRSPSRRTRRHAAWPCSSRRDARQPKRVESSGSAGLSCRRLAAGFDGLRIALERRELLAYLSDLARQRRQPETDMDEL